ncbi:uncharacterized protein TNCV_636361 [Trichonephila clavipes]|nr:uncharacterized protein TNCV_636361 [Trichonephila clavipes]
MSEEALVDHIFVRLKPQVQDYVKVRNPQNTVQLLEVLSKFEERYSCKAMWGSRNCDNVQRRGVTTRMAVEEISGSTAGIDFRRMIEDLTIGDTNLEMGVKKTILVEGTTEIGVRVRILVEAIGGKGDD